MSESDPDASSDEETSEDGSEGSGSGSEEGGSLAPDALATSVAALFGAGEVMRVTLAGISDKLKQYEHWDVRTPRVEPQAGAARSLFGWVESVLAGAMVCAVLFILLYAHLCVHECGGVCMSVEVCA